MVKNAGKKEKRDERYDQERWLQAALDVLAKEGGARLRVDAIASSLNVTKGSFYHHFRDRSDFVAKLSEFWASRFTEFVIREAGALPGNGYEKLSEVIRLVAEGELDKYDIAFRSWAAQDPFVAGVVRDVDLARYHFIRSLFVEMGFSGSDLEMRLRAWLVYASSARSVSFPPLPQCGQPSVQAVLEFFTGKQG